MDDFLKRLQELDAERLPEIEETVPSKRSARRIEKMARAKLARGEDRRGAFRAGHALRRAALTAAALILLLGTAVTVYAYRAEIGETAEKVGAAVRRFFTREEELIDQNAQIIRQSAETGDVTMTVEKAVRDADKGYLYLTFERKDGFFEGDALLYDRMTLKRSPTGQKNGGKIQTVETRTMGENGYLAGDFLCLLKDGPVSRVSVIMPFEITEAGEYQLTIDRLYSVSENTDGARNLGEVAEYAESLSVSFAMDELKNSIGLAEYHPGSEFTIDGMTLTLESVRFSPIEITLEIADLANQTVELGEYQFPAIDYLLGFLNPVGIPLVFDDPARMEYGQNSVDIAANAFDVKAEFRDGVSSVDRYRSSTSFYFAGGFGENGLINRVQVHLRLTAPVYESDVVRLYLERGEGETVTIWEAPLTED